MKQCSRCKGIFRASEKHFYGDRSKRDGLRTYCKTCDHKQWKQNYWRRRSDLWLTYSKRERLGRNLMEMANIYCGTMGDDERFIIALDKKGNVEFATVEEG